VSAFRLFAPAMSPPVKRSSTYISQQDNISCSDLSRTETCDAHWSLSSKLGAPVWRVVENNRSNRSQQDLPSGWMLIQTNARERRRRRRRRMRCKLGRLLLSQYPPCQRTSPAAVATPPPKHAARFPPPIRPDFLRRTRQRGSPYRQRSIALCIFVLQSLRAQRGMTPSCRGAT